MSSKNQQTSFVFKDLLPAICLFLFGITGLAYANLAPTGLEGQYGILLPPWLTSNQVIAVIDAVNGEIIEVNDRINTILVYSEQSDAVAALYRAGAWLVFEPTQLGGCFSMQVEGTGA